MSYERLHEWKGERLPEPYQEVGVNRPPNNLFEAIKWREKEEKVTLMVIIGDRGTGKSNTALWFAKMLDPSFSIEKRLFFRVGEYLKFLKETGKSKEFIWAVLDEAGLDLDSYRWWNKMALTFKYLTEVGRVSRVSLILTLPNFSSLNKATRRLTNFVIMMWRQGFGRIYVLEPEAYEGYIIRNKWLDVKIPRMDPITWAVYEDAKFKFWSEFLEKEVLEATEDKPKEGRPRTELDPKIIDIIRTKNMSYSEIRKHFHLTDWTARKYRDAAAEPLIATDNNRI